MLSIPTAEPIVASTNPERVFDSGASTAGATSGTAGFWHDGQQAITIALRNQAKQT